MYGYGYPPNPYVFYPQPNSPNNDNKGRKKLIRMLEAQLKELKDAKGKEGDKKKEEEKKKWVFTTMDWFITVSLLSPPLLFAGTYVMMSQIIKLVEVLHK